MNDLNDFFGFVGAFALLGLLIAALMFGIVFVIPLGIASAAGIVIYSRYSPNSKRNREKAEIAETYQLYDQARALAPIDRTTFAGFVDKTFENQLVISVAMQLFDMEGYKQLSPPPPVVTGIEGGRYRDELKRFINLSHDQSEVESFKVELTNALRPFDYTPPDTGFFSAKQYLNPEEVDELVHGFFGEHSHFKILRETLDRNFNEQDAIPPRDYRGDNCPWDYLKDTPLLELELKATSVNWQQRAAHTLILAGSGAGKTTLFKHMIAKLLEEDCCVVVMDSQSQLIEELAHLQLGPRDVTWISPEHELALNPFTADNDRKDEAAANNRVSLLKFVVEHLIEAEMTSKQDTLFHHCCQLVFTIPNANVETFKDVLRDASEFTEYIEKLDETSRKFFTSELQRSTGSRKRGVYDSTREELSYRLDGLTRQATFRRIFGAEENTFNFYDEMLDRKLILLDTNQGLLSDDSPTFGRYFVAQALQACFKRVRNKKTNRPVYFFIDEAHEVFDEKLERMLLQARKANVGMVLATQDLSRATKAGITDTLVGSTATKIISQVGAGDAKRVASRMGCSVDYLTSLPEHVFAFSTGSTQTVSVMADPDSLAEFDQHEDLSNFKWEMELYYGASPKKAKEKDNQEDQETEEIDAKEEMEENETTMKQNDDQDITPGAKL